MSFNISRSVTFPSFDCTTKDGVYTVILIVVIAGFCVNLATRMWN